MKGKWKWVVCVTIVLGLVAVPLLVATSAHADKLADAIAAVKQGTGKGEINAAAPKGFLGIPGGPDLTLWIGNNKGTDRSQRIDVESKRSRNAVQNNDIHFSTFQLAGAVEIKTHVTRGITLGTVKRHFA